MDEMEKEAERRIVMEFVASLMKRLRRRRELGKGPSAAVPSRTWDTERF